MAKSGKDKKAARQTDAEGRLVVATNRRARFDYEILDRFEAGLQLMGPEVKSLREGRCSLGDAFATVHRGEAWLEKMHVSPYEPATRDNPTDPMRRRKLLLHRHEIDRLEGRIAEKGLTLVPVCVYFKRGRAKVELALARGKHRHDKRETIKRREGEREAQRAMRRHTR
ncbi:MAG: SsrA-binding protein SmpB [Spirochaetaceae bacterium]|nr:SsrA-binding protein SmpB [Myxococcales bacterium]MCB9724433.1 SsrA-binding protein SmpB [Spirochaetaceae bacterium]HPG25304.1 SsrA-binding protein SmpB [Myxococcota bacterium]